MLQYPLWKISLVKPCSILSIRDPHAIIRLELPAYIQATYYAVKGIS